MEEEISSDYENIQIEKDEMEDIHRFVDNYRSPTTDNGGEDEVFDNTIPVGASEDNIAAPESYDIAAHKYNIEPDIAPEQQHAFGPNRSFMGRHVVNSNTKRQDNFRHLMQFDLCDDYDLIPTRRQRCNQIRQRVTAEYQACRSNPEIGGFDRKLQRAVIKREDVDVKQTQTLNSLNKKKKGILGIISGKK